MCELVFSLLLLCSTALLVLVQFVSKSTCLQRLKKISFFSYLANRINHRKLPIFGYQYAALLQAICQETTCRSSFICSMFSWNSSNIYPSHTFYFIKFMKVKLLSTFTLPFATKQYCFSFGAQSLISLSLALIQCQCKFGKRSIKTFLSYQLNGITCLNWPLYYHCVALYHFWDDLSQNLVSSILVLLQCLHKVWERFMKWLLSHCLNVIMCQNFFRYHYVTLHQCVQ